MTTEYIPEDAEEAALIAASMPRWDHITDVLKPADTWEHGFCDSHLCHCDYTPDNCNAPGGECPGLNFAWGSSLEEDKKHITFSHERESESFTLDLMNVKKNGDIGKIVTASLDFNDLLGLQLAVGLAVKRYQHWDRTFDWNIKAPAPVLLAIDEQDAADYKRIHPELNEALVFTVDQRGRMEGLRMTGAHATPAAVHHDDYDRAYRIMQSNYFLTTREAPRIL